MTSKQPTEKTDSLALITARTLRDHLGSVGKGKHADELCAAIDEAEGKKKAPEPEAVEYTGLGMPKGKGDK